MAIPTSAGRFRKVWQTAPPDTDLFFLSAASAGDVNGDGYDDVIVGAPTLNHGDTLKVGVTYIYFGSPSGLSNTPSVVLYGSDAGSRWNSNYGSYVAGVGDVNGDGFGDVLVSAYGDNKKAFLYFGGRPMAGQPGSTLLDNYPTNPDWFGFNFCGAGLINGGPIPGIVIGAYSFEEPQGVEGRFFTFFGRRNWPPVVYPDQELDGTDPERNEEIGRGVAGIGDVTGDGYPDLLVGATNNSERYWLGGKVYVFTGGPGGVNSEPLAWYYGETPWSFLGEVVDSVGRVFGSPYNDVFWGYPRSKGNTGPSPGKVYLVEGGPSLRGEMVPRWVKEGGYAAQLGYDIAGWQDVNGDGFADFLVSSIQNLERGAVYLYLGGDTVSQAPHETLGCPNVRSKYFGGIVTRIGKIDDSPWPKFLTSEAPNGDQGNFYDLLTIWEWIETAEVTNLRAVAWREKNTVVVGWDGAFEKDTRGYEVYRSLSPDTISWSKVSPLIAPDTIHRYGFADHSVRGDSTSYYWVRVIGKWAGRDLIGPVSSQPGTVALTGLNADWLGKYVSVTWTCSREDGIASYRVYRAEGQGVPVLINTQLLLAGRGSYLWSDSSVREGSAYSYWVGAVNWAGEEERFGPVVTGGYEFALDQNHPNPVASSGTKIAYVVGGVLGRSEGRVSLKAYDVTGALVRVLMDESKKPGRYEAYWNARDAQGRPLPSGVYFLRLEAGGDGGVSLTRKLVVLR